MGSVFGGRKSNYDLAIFLGHKGAHGEFTIDDHGQGGGLHAADGELFVEGERVSSRQVHADEPIGAAASAGGVAEAIVIVSALEAVKTGADGFGGEGRNPKPFDGLIGVRGFIDIAEDEFAFAPGVRGTDYAADFRRVQNLAHDFELVFRFVVDDEGPVLGQHGQQVTPPLLPLGPDLVRLG